MEILADLKLKKTGKTEYEKVKIIANKILNMDMVINAHYLHMLYNSVGGYEPVLDGRPNLPGGRAVVDKNGNKGVVFEPSEEEIALNRWRAGEFKEAEEVLAMRWRSAIENIDLESLVRIRKEMKATFLSLEDIRTRIEAMFENPQSQASLVVWLGKEFAFSDKLKVLAMKRLGSDQQERLLKNVAPYASYCLKVNLIFKYGVMYGFIGTRATNRIDMQYLYYLPFCDIFTSNDKFHADIAPLLLRPYQIFASGLELKQDLSNIARHKGGEPIAPSGPPDIKNSLTVSLWRKKLKSNPLSASDRISPNKRTEKSDARAVSHSQYLAGLIDDPKSHYHGVLDNNEIDFMIVKRLVGPGDPCPCKSGKLFKDCHWDEIDK